ncbi:CU044_5270 family protein [Streptomyces sp. NPDC007264]|uniref:CU044_5270 family protein n=1 Tax=Streptomyces sp. NPDC007264 TaxID=3364777 RepID=UPI0036DC4F8B
MNADTPHCTGPAESEAEALLASSAAWDLPRSRHLHHKEVLMQQIDRDRISETLGSSTAQPRRRLLRPAMVLPVAAVLTGVLVVTASGGDHDSASRRPASAAGLAADNGASATLDRIAAAALSRDVKPVEDSQFVYAELLIRENAGTFDGPVRLGALHKKEVWTVQGPGPTTTTGWIRETGKDAVMPGERIPVVDRTPVRAGLDHPTYKWLATLPTDPEALRTLLYAQTKSWDGLSKDETVFRSVGELLGSTIMPPATASALYKVVEKIPGVTVTPDTVDAAGRHGIGISRKDPASTTRDEWIFNKDTLAYLGSRSYLTAHQGEGKGEGEGVTADTLYGIDAVMERGVVDTPGETPASPEG